MASLPTRLVMITFKSDLNSLRLKKWKIPQPNKENKAYPTTSINGGSDGAIFEIDQLANIINICSGTIREHGSPTGESETITIISNPILHGLLHSQFLVWYIGVPHQITAQRPFERVSVAVGSRYAALEKFILLWAVSFSVYQPVPAEFQ